MTHILRIIRRFSALCLTLLALVGSAFLSDWLNPLFWFAPSAGLKAALVGNALALGTLIVAGVAFYLTNSDSRDAQKFKEKYEIFKNALKSVGDDYYDIWKNILSIWAAELSFTASERISVYKHTGKAFLMLGRYSLNPTFAKRGRATYPDGEGCIAAAWNSGNGSCFTNQLPDPARGVARYQQVQQDSWGLPPDVTRDLTMKPRSIAAFCVLDATGTQRQAIVVFESTRSQFLDEAVLRQFLIDKGSNQVVLLMDALKFQEPSLELAKKEGFG